MITLYDLAGAEEDRRLSPFCWRVRLALAHKGLDVRTIPHRFTDKDQIAFSGQYKVPVLVDDAVVVNESWNIACYLEDKYKDRKSLFGGHSGQALCRFVSNWADVVLHPQILRGVVLDIYNHVHERDRYYFRSSREKRFGQQLEAYSLDRDAWLALVRSTLEPVRLTLKAQSFITGEEPAYADYVVFSAFQWVKYVSTTEILEAGDPLTRWRDNLSVRFEGT